MCSKIRLASVAAFLLASVRELLPTSAKPVIALEGSYIPEPPEALEQLAFLWSAPEALEQLTFLRSPLEG